MTARLEKAHECAASESASATKPLRPLRGGHRPRAEARRVALTGICSHLPCPPGQAHPCSWPARRRRPTRGGLREAEVSGDDGTPERRRADAAHDAELDASAGPGNRAAGGVGQGSGLAARRPWAGAGARIHSSVLAFGERNLRRSMESLPTREPASPGVPLKSSTPTASLPLESLKTYLAESVTAAGEGSESGTLAQLRGAAPTLGSRTSRLEVARDSVREHVAPAVGRLEDEAGLRGARPTPGPRADERDRGPTTPPPRLPSPRQPIELLQGDLPQDELARSAWARADELSKSTREEDAAAHSSSAIVLALALGCRGVASGTNDEMRERDERRGGAVPPLNRSPPRAAGRPSGHHPAWICHEIPYIQVGLWLAPLPQPRGFELSSTRRGNG